MTYPSDVAFSPKVKEIQARKGSREGYARVEAGRGWSTEIPDDLAAFIAEQTSMFLATSSAAGQPYLQHRGGPKGFLRVTDPRTIAFADYKGNRQYITQGNLAENDKAFLFLIDYPRRLRFKIWGRAEVNEGDAEALAALMPSDYAAQPEQVIRFHVTAWDRNCPQHIPQLFAAEDVARALAKREAEIAALEAEIARLKGALSGPAVEGTDP